MGAPGDRFEREADSMADGVVQRMQAGEARGRGAPSLQAKCSACQEEDEKLQREPQACESCGEPLQAKSEGSMDVPESVQQTLGAAGGGGAALQPDLREEMESAFAADFGDVRIHTGGTAAKLNHDLHARAFTHGSDIYFNTGEFQPHSQSGRHLLAHELAHVLQHQQGIDVRARGLWLFLRGGYLARNRARTYTPDPAADDDALNIEQQATRWEQRYRDLLRATASP